MFETINNIPYTVEYRTFNDNDEQIAVECETKQQAITETEKYMDDYYSSEMLCGNKPKDNFEYTFDVYKFLIDEDGEEHEKEHETITTEFIWED